MNIDSIQNGVVIDHIKSGKSMDIYRYLHLDELDCQVAIIKNAATGRLERLSMQPSPLQPLNAAEASSASAPNARCGNLIIIF